MMKTQLIKESGSSRGSKFILPDSGQTRANSGENISHPNKLYHNVVIHSRWVTLIKNIGNKIDITTMGNNKGRPRSQGDQFSETMPITLAIAHIIVKILKILVLLEKYPVVIIYYLRQVVNQSTKSEPGRVSLPGSSFGPGY